MKSLRGKSSLKKGSLRLISYLISAFVAVGLFSNLSIEAFAQEEKNLISNGSFENGEMGNWKPRGEKVKLEVTKETKAFEGEHSLKVTGRTQNWNGPAYSVKDLMENEKTYKISLKVKAVEGQAALGKDEKVTLSMQKTIDGSDAYNNLVSSVAINESDWTTINTEYTLSYSGELTVLDLYLESNTVDLEFYVDDFSIVDTTVVEMENVITNPGFENGKSDWTQQGPVKLEVVKDIAHTGNYSLKASGRTDSWNAPSYSLSGKLEAGKNYEFSAWVMFDEGENTSEEIKTTFISKANGETKYDQVAIVKAEKGVWSEMKGEIKITEGSEPVSIYIESPSKNLVYYIDDISILSEVKQKPMEIETNIPSLHETLKDYFLVGGAVNPWYFGNNSLEEQLVKKHYNIITAENAMKPDALQKEEGVFTFEEADKLVDYAKANNTIVRGHTLVWHSQVPDWFFEDENSADGVASKELLLERERTHIKAVLNHYKEKYGTADGGSPIKYWDVVNEVIDDDGEYRNSKWYQIAGLDFIRVAFETAHEVDPSLKLYINDYNIERNNAKTNKLYELVKLLKSEGVPIDGIGLQMHVSIDVSIESIKKSIEKYESIPDIEIQVTELDTAMGVENEAVTSDVLIKQGRFYKKLFDLFKSKSDRINAVVIWGVIDDTSWIKESKPILFDGKYKAKPAFYSIVSPEKAIVSREEVQAVQGTPKNENDTIWTTIRNIDVNTFYKNVEGATGKVQVMWDENNLYIKMNVSDTTISDNDKVELFINDEDTITLSRKDLVSDKDGYSLYKVVALKDLLSQDDILGFDIRITDMNVNNELNSIVVLNDYSNSQETTSEKYAYLKLGGQSKIESSIFGSAVIDGKMDESWDLAKEITTNQWVTGDSGATAKVRTMWDGKYLYVFADIHDELLNKSNKNQWEQDSVEIFIDQNNNKTAHYQEDDAQIRINFENELSGSGYDKDALKSQTVITDTGYIVEVAIPLDKVEVKDGDLVGFDFQVNDSNEDGVRTGVVTWCDGSGGSYANTSGFGNLKLTKSTEIEEPTDPENPTNPENPEQPVDPDDDTEVIVPETPNVDNNNQGNNQNGGKEENKENLPNTGGTDTRAILFFAILLVVAGSYIRKHSPDIKNVE